MPHDGALHPHAAFWQRPRPQALSRSRRSVLGMGIALSLTVASAATAEVPAGHGRAAAGGALGGPVSSNWADEASRSFSDDPLLAELTAPPASPVADAAALAAIDTRVDISGIPVRVLMAYRAAADRLRAEQPRCALPWGMLAAIGQVETGHGRFGGAAVDVDGRVLPEILGPRLDGAGQFAQIRDSDGGLYDRDLEYDRAVGPMQFLPTTWAAAGADGDGDARNDPHDIDDVALAAGRYLCAAGSFASPAGSVQAVFSYNHSYEYVRLVITLAAGYSGRTPASFGIDLLPPPPGAPPPPPAPVVAAAPAPPPPPPPPAPRPKAAAPAAAAPQAPAAAPKPPPPPPPAQPAPVAPAPAAVAPAPAEATTSPSPTTCPSPGPTPAPSPPSSCPSPSPSPAP